ncbi:methyltransferase domain-containing protein [Fibrobacterota bacterium]
MDKEHPFICPETLRPFTLEVEKEEQNQVVEGRLISENKVIYPIHNGVPDLVFPRVLPEEDQSAKNWYDDNADVYDDFLPLTFDTFSVDELAIRREMVSQLDLKPDYKVLETGCGTGRDSVLIAEHLGENGELHLQDISYKILEKSFDKMKEYKTHITFSLSNACYLPFPDNYFDVYYHFGGFNTFSEKKRAFSEISRVTKIGGKVIVGDESMPSWLRSTDFGKILMNSNPHYKYELPLEYMHVSARDVSLHWIIGGVFYYLSYTIGEGEPDANLDFEIPGPRGGTHRTRYFGHIEGVSEEVIDLARKAREKTGKSMYRWLDDAIKKAAKDDLGI